MNRIGRNPPTVWEGAGLLALLTVVAAMELAGCVSRPEISRSAAPALAADVPEQVDVPSAVAQVGFTSGVLRSTQSVGTFRISRHPTTIGQFSACVRAGACRPSVNDCAAMDTSPVGGPNVDADDQQLPAVCVEVEQAANHCAWLGGRLPNLAEWLLAARGQEPRRYAWGDSPPSCEQHPLGTHGASADGTVMSPVSGAPCAASDSEVSALFRVGRHQPGKAESGLEDVLLTAGELIAADARSPYAACSPPYLGCVVSGLKPGAIDTVIPTGTAASAHLNQAASPAIGRAIAPYSYRCVWGEP